MAAESSSPSAIGGHGGLRQLKRNSDIDSGKPDGVTPTAIFRRQGPVRPAHNGVSAAASSRCCWRPPYRRDRDRMCWKAAAGPAQRCSAWPPASRAWRALGSIGTSPGRARRRKRRRQRPARSPLHGGRHRVAAAARRIRPRLCQSALSQRGRHAIARRVAPGGKARDRGHVAHLGRCPCAALRPRGTLTFILPAALLPRHRSVHRRRLRPHRHAALVAEGRDSRRNCCCCVGSRAADRRSACCPASCA